MRAAIITRRMHSHLVVYRVGSRLREKRLHLALFIWVLGPPYTSTRLKQIGDMKYEIKGFTVSFRKHLLLNDLKFWVLNSILLLARQNFDGFHFLIVGFVNDYYRFPKVQMKHLKQAKQTHI